MGFECYFKYGVIYLLIFIYFYIYIKIDLNHLLHNTISITAIPHTMASQSNSEISKEHQYDLDQVVKDVQAIVSSTLKEKLKCVYDMNREYKETHDAVMKIPAVRKLVHPSNLHDVATEIGCEEMQRLIAENASLKVKVSELEHSILKMMDSQDAHFTSLEPEPENITLVIKETEDVAQDETVESDDDDDDHEIDMAALAAAHSIANNYEEESDSDENEEEEADSAENEEIVVTHDSEEEEEEEEEVEEDEQENHEESDEEEEEDAEEEEEEEEEEEVEMNEEVEVIEVEIKGKAYFTTDEISGVIYACTLDGDIGDEVGKFVNRKASFNTRK